MEKLNKIRQFFIKPNSSESNLIKLINNFNSSIEKLKHGTTIGNKENIDYINLINATTFPLKISNENDVIEKVSKLYKGLIQWGHPLVQMNVIPPPTNISIASETLSAIYNQNSIWDLYGTSAAQSEVLAVAMLSDLIGYDTSKSGGLFTFGGSGCNLYATRIAIEKALPNTKQKGLHSTIHVFCSDIAHYSIKSSIIWTGIGMDNIKVIPSNDDNIMDTKILKKEIEKSIKEGAKIGIIFATMGTTDAFGIDPLKEIVDVRNKIEKTIDYPIHIHADAVIGWPYLTFKGDKNIQRFSKKLQNEIKSVVKKMEDLKYADSVGIDFHKTGWAPYICSAIIVKNKKDFSLLEKTHRDMPYLYHGEGYKPGVFTLESSRPDYAQKALVNMLLLGKEGYENIIAHLLYISDYLREKIEKTEDIVLLNRHNPAFVTDFRFYPKSRYDSDGKLLFEKELHNKIDKSFTNEINNYNQKIVDTLYETSFKTGGSFISFTNIYKPTLDNRSILALKSYPMSLFIEKDHMDILLKDLYNAKRIVDKKINNL